MILDRIRAVVLSPGGKRPASPDEAVALAKRAYDDVTAYLTKIRPAKLEVRPTPSGASVTPAAKPKRSEEHTSELQSLMRISYAVFCLKKKKNTNKNCTALRHNIKYKQT